MDADTARALLEERSFTLPPDKLPTGCRVWAGARIKAGYGEIRRGGKMIYTHRLSWEAHHGPIPPGMNVLHRCDNPPCWEPEHLFLGTHQDNMTDKVAKGRLRHGHLYGDQHPARARPDYLKRGEQHGMAKLTWETVRAIRAAYAAGARKADIARQFGVNRGSVHMIVNNQQWKE